MDFHPNGLEEGNLISKLNVLQITIINLLEVGRLGGTGGHRKMTR